jgi:hypothetical protein
LDTVAAFVFISGIFDHSLPGVSSQWTRTAAHLITSHKAFLLPVVIDETSEEEESRNTAANRIE